MPIKLIVAHNLAELRKARGLTQVELAEKFNYTDKSVSKWEHGDTLPDIEVLKQLCDFYGVTLDYLVTEDPQDKPEFMKDEGRVVNKWAIVGLSVLAVWLLAIVFFFAGQVMLGEDKWAAYGWLAFLWATPAMFIVLLVFNGLWGRSAWRSLLAALLMWTTLTCIYVTLGLFVSDGRGWNLWPIFLIGVPLTIASILWDYVLAKPKKSKEKKPKE